MSFHATELSVYAKSSSSSSFERALNRNTCYRPKVEVRWTIFDCRLLDSVTYTLLLL